jgi:DNA-binding NarL/FixJ family response regulator
MQIVIVDDHPLMRSALIAIVQDLAPHAQVVAFSRLQAAHRHLQAEPLCQLVLLDLNLPDSSGAHAVNTLVADRPDCAVVVISADVEPHVVRAVMQAGARGYIPKTASPQAMMQALNDVVNGKTSVPAEYASYLRPAMLKRTVQASVQTHPLRQGPSGLTERQQDVLNLILRGLPNKLICRQLALAEGTVKVHVSAVLRALGVRNRTEVVVAAARMGWQRE